MILYDPEECRDCCKLEGFASIWSSYSRIAKQPAKKINPEQGTVFYLLYNSIFRDPLGSGRVKGYLLASGLRGFAGVRQR